MFRLSKIRSLSSMGSILTLSIAMIYSVSSLKLNSIHQFFHSENLEELHSAIQESDPCHKNIYHQQSASGCEHKSHVTENTKCPICEHSASSKIILSSILEVDSLPLQGDYVSAYSEADYSANLITRVGRGPPQV